MSKYIPAIRVVSKQFTNTEPVYDMAYSTNAFDNYQDALNAATKIAVMKQKEPPIVRADGLEFKKDHVTPVVLKEVEMVEV